MQKTLTQNEEKIRAFADKLAVLYELFNWKWCDEVPCSKKIEETIHYLIKRTKEVMEEDCENYGQVSTGGITVMIDEYDNLDIKWAKEEAIYLQLTNELIG